VRVTIDFHAPSRFDDELDVSVRTDRIGRTSMTFALGVFPKHEASLLVSGSAVWVNADQKTHKSTPVPGALAELLEAMERRKLRP
jgi:acyl-CoA thioester hydrolase